MLKYTIGFILILFGFFYLPDNSIKFLVSTSLLILLLHRFLLNNENNDISDKNISILYNN